MKNQDILSEIDHKSGMTVPDNYFADFQKRMEAALPEQEWEKPVVVAPRTFWQKVRPYVYMAAMFAGVWCMMKMFNIMGSTSSLSVEDNPTLMTAINNDAFFYDYCAPTVEETDLYNDLYEQGFDPEDFSSDNE